MNLMELVDKCPYLSKITESVIQEIAINKSGSRLDFNKTFAENYWDELDCVELVMELEKILSISIDDHIADVFFGLDSKPPRFSKYFRNKNIDTILND